MNREKIITDLNTNGELQAGILKYVNGDKSLAKDIKQELFIILLNKDESYFKKHADNNSLLFSCLRIAKNLAVNFYRDSAKKPKSLYNELEDEEEKNYLHAAQDVLHTELKKVYHFDRKLLELALQGKTAKDIASHYNINVAYVRRALNRGKLELACRIESKISEDDLDVITYPVYKKPKDKDTIHILDQIETQL